MPGYRRARSTKSRRATRFTGLRSSSRAAVLAKSAPKGRVAKSARFVWSLDAQSAEQIQNQQDEQNRPDNPHASTCSPSRVAVIASATAEQEHQDNDQQQHGISLPFTKFFNRVRHNPKSSLAAFAAPDFFMVVRLQMRAAGCTYGVFKGG